MQYTYTRSLSETELVQHLRSQDEILFRIPGIRWQDVERQVERLGFGDTFLVSAMKGTRGECCKVTPYSWHGTEAVGLFATDGTCAQPHCPASS